ncbi:hypothetical protein PITCH_A620009 [uncultured Desulfobacterium sp.]|uniref:Uncharacterized protein n=1 Tax=uncultured Desulfobacterium sp. TaxID=201089 RepID=A0A445N144_9BACT|nr:hypothetical protein PITCH_A620009 [uncultured Desulfobacterium sp.]
MTNEKTIMRQLICFKRLKLKDSLNIKPNT